MKQLSEKTKAFIRSHKQDNPKTLALQASKYPEVDMHEAITQINGIQIASVKIPSWAQQDNILYPKHLSMEQCSSEITAKYKSTLINGNSLTDLTGGFGVDCAFMATKFNEADYVERQEMLCEIAKHNFNALGLNQIRVHNAEATDYLPTMKQVDWIFIDPARRDGHGGKTIAISDCEPNVEELEELLTEKGQQVMVKLSPMLDISLASSTLHYISQIHIISVSNDCKELLLILDKKANHTEVPIYCINLTNNGIQQFAFSRDEEQQAICKYTDELGHYLYEPNASIMKAGAYKCIANRYDLMKLNPNSHLYTSSELIADFPGRIFEIKKQCTFNKKELKEMLGGIKKANLTIRNFPSTVADLRKRIKLNEGGDDYLFATTLNNDKKVLILCSKIENI